MRKTTNLKVFAYIAFLFFFTFPKTAHAYLDPSTGSYLFQFLIAGVLGGVFFMKGYIFKAKDQLQKFIKRPSGGSPDEKK